MPSYGFQITEQPVRRGRTVSIRLLVGAAVAAAALIGPGAVSAATPGSEYEVGFSGTGTVDVHWTVQTGTTETGATEGTWQVLDSAAQIWLPSGAPPETPALDGWSTTDGQPSESQEDPASITSSGGYYGAVDCDQNSIPDLGYGTLSAEATGAGIRVVERYAGTPAFPTLGRQLTIGDCDGNSNGPLLNFPLGGRGSGNYDIATGGEIGYGGTVPFGQVGQADFSLAAADESTIDTAPWWAKVAAETGGEITYPSHELGITGTFTFHKLCDGTIELSAGYEIGTCGASAGGGGGGGSNGGGPGAGAGAGTPSGAPSPSGSRGAAATPDTRITKAKVQPRRREATFSFTATGSGASFECRLDAGRFKHCTSPKPYRGLKPGPHRFEVRGVRAGTHDPSPAIAHFRIGVKRTAHHH